jgi:hypothetical protein
MTGISAVAESKATPWPAGVRILAALGLVAVVGTAAFADYLSSWVGTVGGYPVGAIVRDGVAIAFVCFAGAILLRERSGWSRESLVRIASPRSDAAAGLAFLPFAAFAIWVALLLVPSPAKVPAVLAARNLLLYPMVGFATYVLVTRRCLDVKVLLGTLGVFGFIAATLGILDTATHGGIVTSLGYRRDYAGVEGTANRLIAGASAAFQGYVRASGGISNALVFGYLMAAMAVFATWMLERAVVRSGWRSGAALAYAALGIVAGVACIDSITRGALIALVLGMFLLVVLRRSRPVLLGALSTVILSLFLAWAASVPLSAAVPGQAAGPGLLDVVGTRVTSSDTSSQASSGLRLDQVRLGLKSLAARPMGNGLGTEGSASNRAAQLGIATDNFILIVALQTGIIGAGLYGLIFVAMILWAVKRPTRDRALVVAMIGIFGVASALSASPDAPVFATTIWILLLAVSAAPALDDYGDGPIRPGDKSLGAQLIQSSSMREG